MRRLVLGAAAGILVSAGAQLAIAHSAVCSCFDNGDETITCEGGFSDGSSAAGVVIRVLDARDKLLLEGKMDDSGTFTFKKPADEYHVVFDAGQSHVVTIDGADITA